MNLRPRHTQPFSGFTKPEVMKMEHLLNEIEEQSLDKEFFQNLANDFNRSINRTRKPRLKWTEIQNWFEKNQQLFKETSFDAAKKLPESPTLDIATDNPKMPDGAFGVKGQDISTMEFEARSKDGAWYDVDAFLSHRDSNPGEIEVCVRYVGFGADYDEWVNLKNDVRERSVTFDDSECQKVKVGDLVVCFQERKHQARYYDGHVIEIQRKLHDVRGCRCLFLIKYDHDNTQEKVRLQRLCGRPNCQGGSRLVSS